MGEREVGRSVGKLLVALITCKIIRAVRYHREPKPPNSKIIRPSTQKGNSIIS